MNSWARLLCVVTTGCTLGLQCGCVPYKKEYEQAKQQLQVAERKLEAERDAIKRLYTED